VSVEEYADAKARIFDRCEVAVVNADDARVRAMPRRGQRVLSFSLSSPDADFTLAAQPEPLLIRRGQPLMPLSRLRLQGRHNAANAMAALAMCEALELPAHRADVWLLHEARVPLLVRLPGGRHAGPRHDPAGQVDVAPTIADLLGLPWERTFFHGRSLVSDPGRPVVLPDGSAISEELVLLGREARWGPPNCLDAATGAPVSRERCDALADHAARELAVSRAEVNQDLFRWMIARVSGGEPIPPVTRAVRGAAPDVTR